MFGARRPTPLACLMAAIALAGALSSAPVRAEEPGQWAVGISAGGAELRVDQRWRQGLQAGAEGRYGLAEFWAVRGAFHLGWHPGEDGSRAFPRVQTATAALALVYAWDVLRVVPFGEAGLAVTGIRGDLSQRGGLTGVQLGAGLSYLIDRQWAIASCLRFQHLPLAIPGGWLSDAPVVLGLLVRADRRF
jgi:hypothetical protein